MKLPSSDRKARSERVAARYAKAASLAPPRESATTSHLKTFGLTPGNSWGFGSDTVFRPTRTPVVVTGEQVQDKRGTVWFFVGIDSKAKPILAADERELKRLTAELKRDRNNWQSISKAGAAVWDPGEIIQEGWQPGQVSEAPEAEGTGSQVPPARDQDGQELTETETP